jgi:hypothetical protein
VGFTNGPVGETDSAVIVLEEGKKPLQETSETSINATTPSVAQYLSSRLSIIHYSQSVFAASTATVPAIFYPGSRNS